MRSITRLLLATVALTAITCAPASAGGSVTRYVDDDGHAGPGRGCSGRKLAATSLQTAIDASSRGDTVLVCPGVYRGWVRVRHGDDGVTIRSTQRGAAILTPPSVPQDTEGPRALLSIEGAVDIRATGLRIEPCGSAPEANHRTGIHVRSSARVVLARNDIRADGCTGIDVWEARRVRIVGNVIRDFGDGISIGGPRTIATARENRLRCGHRDRPAIYCELGIDAGHGFPDGARVRLIRNDIAGVWSSPAAGGRVSRVLTGIQATVDGLVMRGNRVREVQQGILVHGDGILVARNTIRRNRAFGLWIGYSRGGEVRDNIVEENRGRGIAIGEYGNSVSDLFIHDNVARRNGLADCQDWTTGDGTAGTANVWKRNLGEDSKPVGLCRAGR